MVKKETWHSISMRNIHTIYLIDADTYFDLKALFKFLCDFKKEEITLRHL